MCLLRVAECETKIPCTTSASSAEDFQPSSGSHIARSSSIMVCETFSAFADWNTSVAFIAKNSSRWAWALARPHLYQLMAVERFATAWHLLKYTHELLERFRVADLALMRPNQADGYTEQPDVVSVVNHAVPDSENSLKVVLSARWEEINTKQAANGGIKKRTLLHTLCEILIRAQGKVRLFLWIPISPQLKVLLSESRRRTE